MARSCRDDASKYDSRRRPDGVSTAAVSGLDSGADALPVEKWRDSRLLSLVVLLGKDMPGNPSPLVTSVLSLGVGVGSTDTTDLIGKTRSVADGLIAPNGDSEEGAGIGDLVSWLSFLCSLGLHGMRCVSEAPKLWSWGRGSEKERRCGDDGGGCPVVGEPGTLEADPDLPAHILLVFRFMIETWGSFLL